MLCKKCCVDKEEQYFRVANGYRKKVCKQCESDYQKEHFKNPENRNRRKKYRKKYYEEHREEEMKYATWYNRNCRGRSNKIVNKRNGVIIEKTPQEKERIKVKREINKRVKELEEQEKQQKLEKLKQEEEKQKIMQYFKERRNK